MDSDLIRIEKLQSEEQWLAWKFQVKIILNASDLLDIVDGTTPAPVKGEKQEESAFQVMLRTWKSKDSKAQKVIATTVGQEPMLHIMNSKNSCEMWKKLESVYEQKTHTSIHLLQQRFYSYTKDPDDSMSVHISKLEKIVQQLKDVGEEISESMIITKILMTLPATYNHFYSAWESTSKSEQTLKNLTTRLLMEEYRISQQNSSSSTAAFVAKKSHKINVKYNQPRIKQTKPGKCFICKQQGHWKITCPIRIQKQKQMISDKSLSVRTQGDAFTSECFALNLPDTDEWVLDSGASDHMTSRFEWFANYEKLDKPMPVRIGNGETIFAHGVGDINILSFDNSKWAEKHLSQVLHVPDIKLNLFSSNSALDKGLQLVSNNKKCELLKDNKVVAIGFRKNKLFKLMFKVIPNDENLCANPAIKELGSLKLWHERLVHQNLDQVKSVLKDAKINFKQTGDQFCEACALSKHHRSTFKRSENRAEKPGELVHSDICGPMHETSHGGARYFVLFKDDYSNYRKVYFLKQKSEVSEYIERYIDEIQAETGFAMKTLRSDNGLEYVNKNVEKLLRKHNVNHQKTVPYTPEHNGRAEREMRTLVEAARSLIHSKNLSKKYWAEALNTASYVMNRTGKSPITGKVPFELWFNKKPDISYFRVFGSEAYVHIAAQKRRKLDAKAKKGILVGYAENTKGYRIWIPEERKIEISCDVILRENIDEGEANIEIGKESKIADFKIEPSSESESDDENKIKVKPVSVNSDKNSRCDSLQLHRNESEETDDEVFSSPVKEVGLGTAENNRAKRNLRPRKPISYCYLLNQGYAFAAECDEPKTYNEAINSSCAERWKKAMDDEITSQRANGTWVLTEQPKNAKILNNRWVFKIKEHVANKADQFKARLVAKGISQQYGIDYFETFSPVVKFTSVRALLSIVATEDMALMQFDIKTAFLYGPLEEDVYMRQPEGYEDGTNRVCKLKKSLYGLKQSSRCWNKKFTEFLKRFNLEASKADPCIFSSKKDDRKILLAIYIDDGLVAASKYEDIESLLTHLKYEFEVKSSKASCFLGIQIERENDGSIFLHQIQYAKKVLEKFNMHEANPVSTPADASFHYEEDQDVNQNLNFPYREAVGSLMYLVVTTRPDLAYAVGVVSRYLDKPSKSCINAVKRILKYLKGTQTHGVLFKKHNPFSLNIYSDADYGGDSITRRSTSGVLVCVGRSPISWLSQRQRSVALSTTEAEYVAAAEAVKELVWVQQLLFDLKCRNEIDIKLFMDNQSAIKLIKNPEFHKRSKHIDVRYHFIREKFVDYLI